MKLQLDEQTLNAYINEAVKQELNEAAEETNLTFKVDFDALGIPETKATTPGRDWSNSENWVGNIQDILVDLVSSAGEGLRNINNLRLGAKHQLEIGKFGYANSLMPDYRYLGINAQGRHNDKTRYALIETLRELGYSDRQIGAALKFGKIEAGNFISGRFVPFIGKKQKREIKKIANLTKPSEILTYYELGTEEDLNPLANNDENTQDIPDDTTQGPDVDGIPDDTTQGPDVDGVPSDVTQEPENTEFPWDNYPYDSFPWDDYQARPTPRQPRTQPQGSGTRTAPEPTAKQEQEPNQVQQPTDNTDVKQERPLIEPVPKMEPIPAVKATADTTQTGIPKLGGQTSHPGNIIATMHNIAKEDPTKMSQKEKDTALRTAMKNGVKATRNPDYAGGNKQQQQQARDAIRQGYKNIKRGDNNQNI